MIQARELRIWNWVKPEQPRHNEKYIQVESISNDSINIEFRRYEVDEISAIPLTPELLEKCATQGEHKVSVLDKSATFRPWYLNYPKQTDIYVYQKEDGGFYCGNTEVKYLHQLQNIYFALTGEELPVQL